MWKRSPPRPFHHGVSLREMSAAQAAFWRKERERMFATGAWEQGTCSNFVSQAFLVPKPGGKYRLVLDFRHLNSHCKEFGITFETLKRLRRIARKSDWMISFDMQDGFHCINIAPEDRKYMTFQLPDGELIQCAGLPFGWNCSPYVFCKTMKTLVSALRAPSAQTENSQLEKLRAVDRDAPEGATGSRRGGIPHLIRRPQTDTVKGLRVLPYMDDFLIICHSRAEAVSAQHRVQQVLDLLGLARNPEKGHWEPTQQLEHLGLLVDSKRGLFQVTPKRLHKIRACARELVCLSKRNARLLPVRRLASFVGLAQSVYLAVPPARHFLRELHVCIKTKQSWGARVRLSPQAYRDLQWWITLPQKWNGRAIWRSPRNAKLSADASKLAWGGVLNDTTPARGFWTKEERRLSITELELEAVLRTVQSFISHLRSRHVLLREDNMGVVHMLAHYSSRVPSIMRRLRELWLLLDTNGIELSVLYIRSEANVWADALSRERDTEEWMLNPDVFDLLQSKFGPHTIDRFASMLTAQLPRYNSRWQDPRCEAVDSLSLDWRGENNYCNPPWTLLAQVAQRLAEQPVPCTVVAPHWPDSDWHVAMRGMCSEMLVFPPSYGFFLPGRLGGRDAVGPASWPTVVFRFEA